MKTWYVEWDKPNGIDGPAMLYSEHVDGLDDDALRVIEYIEYEKVKTKLDEAAEWNGLCRDKKNEIAKENGKLVAALNKIAMLGAGELAYTAEYTEQVQIIAREALGVREKRWPY